MSWDRPGSSQRRATASLHIGRVRDWSIARQSREMRPWISGLELALLIMRCPVLQAFTVLDGQAEAPHLREIDNK